MNLLVRCHRDPCKPELRGPARPDEPSRGGGPVAGQAGQYGRGPALVVRWKVQEKFQGKEQAKFHCNWSIIQTLEIAKGNINPILHTWIRDSCFICDGFSAIRVSPWIFYIGMVI
jgi:hypothetical protein